MNPSDVMTKKNRASNVVKNPDWTVDFGNFSIEYEIINENIVHGISKGRLREEQIASIFEFHENLIKSSQFPTDNYYFVLGLSQYSGIGQNARKKYVETLIKFHRKHPFKILFFYGTSRLIKAAINLARPFVPFTVKVTNDLESALGKIPNEQHTIHMHENLRLAVKTDQDKTDKLNVHVNELLEFIGKIDWEADGIDRNRQKDPTHPFNPVFDAIELIKWELDDLYKERTAAENALRESEEKFRKIIESSPMGIHVYRRANDDRFILIDANPAADRILRIDHSKLYNKDIVDAFPAMENTNIPDQYRKVCSEGKQIKCEQIHYEDTNTRRVLEISAFRTANDKMTVLFSDISKRKQSEEALKQSEEKYRNILETMAEGYFEIDLNGNLVFFNSSLRKITGYSQDELKGLNYSKYSSSDTANKMFQVFNQVYKTGQHKSLVDFEINLKDGRTITIDLSATPIKNSVGEITGFRGLMRDVSERKEAEKAKLKLERKLQQARKMKAIGTLAGGVAHDLNNILTAIVSYPELILMDLPVDSPLRDPVKTIQESGKKAAAIVQDLLTLARRGVSVNEIVNLNDVISEYLVSPEHGKLMAFHPNIEIKTNLASSLLNIAGSPVHISKTIMNLVSNSAEAMPDGGNLKISTENKYIDQPIDGYEGVNEGEYVVLTVTDSGVGIAPEEINQIFEPFYTKKEMNRSGTGLGMAVVWGTVKDHKGYIHVESQLRKGTTFRLYFPITRMDNPENQKPIKLAGYMGDGESILVIDDVKEQREIASKILTQLGYSVRTVSSGEEAVKFLDNETVDLLVLDMIMAPGLDGLETYEQIVSSHPKQKAIIVSGFSETKRVKKALRLGAGAYVKKPYTIEQIGLAVDKELKMVL